MEVAYKPSFDTQRKRYSFCFTCEHCAHYDEEKNECLHEFPNKLHLLGYYLSKDKPSAILFCKDFDLS